MDKATEKRLVKRPLNKKTVVITGASSGVGRAAALEFARKGSNLVLAARRMDALNELVEECISLNSNAIAVETDVTEAAALKELARAAVNFGGSIDVWINNAGVLATGGFEDTPVEVHEQVLKTNLLGYLYGAHAVVPYFKKQGYGILINNISVGGWIPTPYAAAYTASKFGLRGFSEVLRSELAKSPFIYVCDLFPAFLDTPGIQHAANYTGKVIQPMPPVFDPERVAKAMVRLAEHPKNYTTTDLAASFFKLAYSLFPGLTRKIASGLMDGYFNNADRIASTTGNLFSPVKYGSSIYGGWKLNLKSKSKPAVSMAAAFAGIAAALFLYSRMK
ncbi:SDR family oxidoreductase [Rubrolithibacter danxiaensis]|uniref:SDR family oxidoreductase n=1 Tax=Rubrolithibacter danxiaensis TaxID=3390805 RepID=UPI003BF77B3D